MQIRIVTRRTKQIAQFNDREWKNADIEHYGRPQNFKEKELRVVAKDNERIVGSMRLTIKRGVCEINSVIVAKSVRGTGVGTALMNKVEEVARKNNVHKLWLETGKGWQAERFYKKLGYRKNTVLPKHYAGHDFILYEKLLA